MGEGESGTNTSTDTYTLPGIKQVARGNLLCDTGSSTQCPVITQKGGMGWEVRGRFKKERTYVYLWLIHVDVWQKPTRYCKAVVLKLKINFKKENTIFICQCDNY